MTETQPVPRIIPQGTGPERLPLPPLESLTEEQRAAAQALIDGPRKGVYGPFVPLLRTPALLDRVAQLGEVLRFNGTLEARIRELVIATAAAEVGNQFEWVMHEPLARAAGVSAEALESIRVGARPEGLQGNEQVAFDFTAELLRRNGVCDVTYGRAVECFGEAGVVELSTLIGYFVMVSWMMNVGRTPSRPVSGVQGLTAHPL
ncbi:carboxymuconolactone decarboxylase family protein [Azohydromonas aeria]|uniref:carboxymuconolactone decarboxylase family protein n=1 Tax=Azohydromonas aeria TaxID=2590212 RepID=UPI0012FC4A62|nr:carboxymuconolactone decarboxylase family protein [Azohydromonas aeria]